MPWARLITFALELWEVVKPSKKADDDAPTASQRDIAIGVASGEAARRAGKEAPRLTKASKP